MRLYLRLFSFCIGRAMDVVTFFIDTCILKNTEFDSFLNQHKHKMFHQWKPDKHCCECIRLEDLKDIHKRSVLHKSQIETIYKLDGAEVAEHVETYNSGDEIKQHCLCKISARPDIKTEYLDIGLVYCLIKTCSNSTFLRVQNHLETIKKIRNDLAHPYKNIMMTEIEFNKKWDDLEKAVLAIAKEINSSFESKEERLISFLKKTDVNLDDVIYRIDCMVEQTVKQEFKKIVKIMDEQNKVLALLQTTADAEKSKQDILDTLQKHYDEYSIRIKELTFIVKCIETEVKSKSTRVSSDKQDDSERCHVEWRLKTPGAWNVEEIKRTLENVSLSRMLSEWFYIERIDLGSLVIHTSVIRLVFGDGNLLQAAIQSFLEKIVEVCEINTDVPETINVEFRIVDILCHTETVRSEMEKLLHPVQSYKCTTNEDNVTCMIFPERKDIGSLTIHTSVRKNVITENYLRRSAIKSFLEKVVEICDINTDAKEAVNIDFRIMNAKSHSGNVKSEEERLVDLSTGSESTSTTNKDTLIHDTFSGNIKSEEERLMDLPTGSESTSTTNIDTLIHDTFSGCTYYMIY